MVKLVKPVSPIRRSRLFYRDVANGQQMRIGR
jgi:hypothetical protein